VVRNQGFSECQINTDPLRRIRSYRRDRTAYLSDQVVLQSLDALPKKKKLLSWFQVKVDKKCDSTRLFFEQKDQVFIFPPSQVSNVECTCLSRANFKFGSCNPHDWHRNPTSLFGAVVKPPQTPTVTHLPLSFLVSCPH